MSLGIDNPQPPTPYTKKERHFSYHIPTFPLPLHLLPARSASPGRLSLFEEELFRSADMGDTSVVAAVSLSYVEGQRNVGVAFVDSGSRLLGACEFVDDEQFCGLDTVIVQVGAAAKVEVGVGLGSERRAGWGQLVSSMHSKGRVAVAIINAALDLDT